MLAIHLCTVVVVSDNFGVAVTNKSSAVNLAEMGDRGLNRHGPKILKLWAVPPFLSEGELGPHLTQCRLSQSLPPYQVAY